MKELYRHSETIKALLLIGVVITSIIILLSNIRTEAKAVTYNDDYHKQVEHEYVEQVRDSLSDQGMDNAGVSLLKTIDPDSGVTYTLKIHHKQIDHMSVQEQLDLTASLKTIVMDTENFTVNIEYI